MGGKIKMTKETKGCQEMKRMFSNKKEDSCNPFFQDSSSSSSDSFQRIRDDKFCHNHNNPCSEFFSDLRNECCSSDSTSSCSNRSRENSDNCDSRDCRDSRDSKDSRDSRSSRDSSDNRDRCCCKKAIKKSLDILLNPCIRTLIDLTSFTLIGQNFTTDPGNTTIKSISNCGDSLITFSDPTGNLSITTLCDLVAIRFNLVPVASTPANSEDELMTMFTIMVQKFLPKINTKKFCCTHEDECCCNKTKASFLANSIGTVNVQINTSALEANPLLELSLITVTDEIAWFFDNNNNVIIICLDDIVALG